MTEVNILQTVWIMVTKDGFYPINPTNICKPSDHGEINDHIIRIEDVDGNVLWSRAIH